jgi:ATP-dependent helicase YprA (DUF1998 family)
MRAGPPKTFEVASSAFQLAVDCGSALVALEKPSPPHRRTRAQQHGRLDRLQAYRRPSEVRH